MFGERRPRAIVLEGLDGCGKSTLLPLLARATGAVVIATPPIEWRAFRAQLDSSVADSPRARAALYAATVLLASDRARAALAVGRSVVIDRYWLSTLAYNEVDGLAPLETGLVRPDVTAFLDVPTDERARRLCARGAGATPEDVRTLDPAFAFRLRELYLRLADHPLAGRMLIMDAAGRQPSELADLVLREAWA
jgi:thymidylate kinase